MANVFRHLYSDRLNEELNPFVKIGGVSQDVADDFFEASGAPPFPNQYSGLRIQGPSGLLELCLVAIADAPPGMGGQLRINKNGTIYAVYLVETNDPNASPLRICTTTGTKAIRRKT